MTFAILLAGGVGKRLESTIPKQFLTLHNKPIIAHTIEVFEKTNEIEKIILVSHADYIKESKKIIKKYQYRKIFAIVNGGKTRQESSYNGIKALPKECKYVLIHDVARPLITPKLIKNIIKALKEHKAVEPILPIKETIIEISEDKTVRNVLDRNRIFLVQTPQGFHYKTILQAHQIAEKENFVKATDDASLLLRYNLCKIKTIKGEEENIKITTKFDLIIAEEIIKRKNFIIERN